ncbi:hypothetical protein [Aromatoleum buckelii]|uniref:Uncharacterized protein n=1 Tax=Aromatoleum buckelii TaxID=200254 RepID=A0ABX1N361_9RHOO|nr:hypothetical protein [Aromatoleum buckelii]MCK0513168.1 hypothetical protein [Aromatoleum buckelii]
MAQSMSRSGDGQDSAVVESVFQLLKREGIKRKAPSVRARRDRMRSIDYSDLF